MAEQAVSAEDVEVEAVPLRWGDGKPWSFPSVRPTMPRRWGLFFFGDACGCCPAYILAVPFLAVMGFAAGLVAVALLLVAALVLYLLVGLPVCGIWTYMKLWGCAPWKWHTDIYVKATYLAYQDLLLRRSTPDCSPNTMSVSLIQKKRKLDKYKVDFAMNIRVPKVCEEEYQENAIVASNTVRIFEEHLSLLPMTDRFEEFADGEDPVQFVMKQLDSVYPDVYQVWTDKRSDEALARFCLHGMGAHRVETTTEDGQQMFVLKTNSLSNIPVRDGFARYGGDVYFDSRWRPVKIVDAGMGPLQEDGSGTDTVTRPGDPGWEHAKFRFRSSMSVLVTLVDHLYGVHLQFSNLMVTAIREQLSDTHPMRRFFTPFMYQTISVNDNARNNLTQPKSLGPRCFAFSDHGLQIAFASAQKLLRSGTEVGPEEGGPFFNRADYADYLKDKHGIDTEYYRQQKRLWHIFRRFVVSYIHCYWPSQVHIVGDPEIQALLRQLLFQIEFVSANALKAPSNNTPAELVALSERMVDLVTNFLFCATAGHEQVGNVDVYVQDVSFCSFKWTPGSMMATKQTATAQNVLMSFTSIPMPKLLGDDWTHLFPAEGVLEGKDPAEVYRVFQQELADMAEYCDEYNATAASREFPECFPMYVLNPKVLETSISI